jgi:uncharacterized iron-regulated protein
MMKRFFYTAVFAVITAGLVFPAGGHEEGIVRVSDGQKVQFSNMLHDLKGVQLVFVGELHDNADHHQIQLTVIQALKQAGVPVAVGLEMFQSGSQPSLDQWVRGDLDEESFQDIYYANWSLHWNLYREIFLYTQQEEIPMVGLNIPPEISRKVADQGFASLAPEELEQLPPVSCRVDATYMAFIKRAYGMHGHDREKSFTHFCEAQIVWDAGMASRLLDFLEENPEYTVVVLAGSGHAWKRGIPDQVRQRSDVSYRVVLPEIPHRGESESVTVEDADYLWLGH